jgi:hypothetical protein
METFSYGLVKRIIKEKVPNPYIAYKLWQMYRHAGSRDEDRERFHVPTEHISKEMAIELNTRFELGLREEGEDCWQTFSLDGLKSILGEEFVKRMIDHKHDYRTRNDKVMRALFSSRQTQSFIKG